MTSIKKSIKIAPLHLIEPLFISTVIMAIDHTTVAVPEDKFRECLAFYVKALEPLGYRVVYEFGDNIVGLDPSPMLCQTTKSRTFGLSGRKRLSKHMLHSALRVSDPAASILGRSSLIKML